MTALGFFLGACIAAAAVYLALGAWLGAGSRLVDALLPKAGQR